jgi:hypothetical protein
MARSIKERTFWILTLVAVAILSAGTLWQLASAQQSQVVDKTPPPPGPCDQGTTEERKSCYNDAYARFEDRYADWITRFNRSGVDASSLERVPLLTNPVRGKPDLSSAVGAADLIATGTVSKVEFVPGKALVTFALNTKIKDRISQAAPEVIVEMSGGPVPGFGQGYDSQDYKNAVLDYLEAAPILLPGERAVLFLTPSEITPAHQIVQNFSGYFKLEGGQVHALSGNPFAAAVDHRPESQFIDAIRALVQ